MDKALEIGPVEGGRVCLKGALTFATVVAGLVEIRALLEEQHSLEIDLQDLSRADSSALAMLIQLLDEAKQQKVGLVFVNLPDFLTRIAKLSNAEAILPIKS